MATVGSENSVTMIITIAKAITNPLTRIKFLSSSLDEKVTESKNSTHEVVSMLSLVLTKKEDQY